MKWKKCSNVEEPQVSHLRWSIVILNEDVDIEGEDVSDSLLVSLETAGKKDDIYRPGTEYDALLAVPHLEHVATVAEEDMERMMKISQEMLDCNLKQADLDCLLNVDNFTEKQSPAVSL